MPPSQTSWVDWNNLIKHKSVQIRLSSVRSFKHPTIRLCFCSFHFFLLNGYSVPDWSSHLFCLSLLWYHSCWVGIFSLFDCLFSFSFKFLLYFLCFFFLVWISKEMRRGKVSISGWDIDDSRNNIDIHFSHCFFETALDNERVVLVSASSETLLFHWLTS